MEGSIITQVIVPICLFLIMFGMGLSLTLADFGRVVRFPLAVSVGLVGQLLFLPIVGFLIAYFFMSEPILAMGLMLLAACPGGTTSNLIAFLAKGDIALSITMTAISSVLTIVTIPFILVFSMDQLLGESQAINIPVERTVLVLFVMTILPVGLGMWVRRNYPDWAAYFEPKINVFSSVFLVVLIVAVVTKEQDVIFNALSDVWVSAILLNVVTMGVAAFAAFMIRLNRAQTTSLTVEVGIQNSALAILLATAHLNSPEMAIVPAIYTLIMYFSGGCIVLLNRKFRASSMENA